MTTNDKYSDFSALVALEETSNHDLIYAAAKLKPGTLVELLPAGTNVRGDLRYRVKYSGMTLGFVVIGGLTATLSAFQRGRFENTASLNAEISSLHLRRFLPPKKVDIRLYLAEMRKVS